MVLIDPSVLVPLGETAGGDCNRSLPFLCAGSARWWPCYRMSGALCKNVYTRIFGRHECRRERDNSATCVTFHVSRGAGRVPGHGASSTTDATCHPSIVPSPWWTSPRPSTNTKSQLEPCFCTSSRSRPGWHTAAMPCRAGTVRRVGWGVGAGGGPAARPRGPRRGLFGAAWPLCCRPRSRTGRVTAGAAAITGGKRPGVTRWACLPGSPRL